MRESVLVRTEGPYRGSPDWCGIWSDPETTAEVLRIGAYEMETGGFRVEVCFWRKPHRYAKALNEILRRAFGCARPIRYRMRSTGGREWYVFTPYRHQRFQSLDVPDMACAQWVRVSL